jgi:folylpolyglutamate synthase/dihydropteroate synthase
LRTERSVPASELARIGSSFGWQTQESTVSAALADSEAWARAEDGIVCIAGSLYLVGEVMEWRGHGSQSRGW